MIKKEAHMKNNEKSNIDMLMQGSFSQAFVRLNDQAPTQLKRKRKMVNFLSLFLPKSLLKFFIL